MLEGIKFFKNEGFFVKEFDKDGYCEGVRLENFVNELLSMKYNYMCGFDFENNEGSEDIGYKMLEGLKKLYMEGLLGDMEEDKKECVIICDKESYMVLGSSKFIVNWWLDCVSELLSDKGEK